MRDFTDVTVIPGLWFIAVDGEGYHCAPFQVADVQGGTRVIPGDRVFALQWLGKHGHGTVDGFGRQEGFTDRAVVEPYVKVWLQARAKDKRDRHDGLVQRQVDEKAALAQNQDAIEAVRQEIDVLTAELAAASPERRAHVQAQIDWANQRLTACSVAIAAREVRATSDETVSNADAEATAAEQETQ